MMVSRNDTKPRLNLTDIAARLLILANSREISWDDIMKNFKSRNGVCAALRRLVDSKQLKVRDIYEKKTRRKRKQWTIVGRDWSALPDGQSVVDSLSRLK